MPSFPWWLDPRTLQWAADYCELMAIRLGDEPHAQPYIKLNALEKKPHVRFDWTETSLRDVSRWANRYLWKYCTLDEYRCSAKTSRAERYDAATGLFA